jgi:hypothetical protein
MRRGDNGFVVAPNVTKTELTWLPQFGSVCIPSGHDFRSYWLCDHDKTATDLGEVGGKSEANRIAVIITYWALRKCRQETLHRLAEELYVARSRQVCI